MDKNMRVRGEPLTRLNLFTLNWHILKTFLELLHCLLCRQVLYVRNRVRKIKVHLCNGTHLSFAYLPSGKRSNHTRIMITHIVYVLLPQRKFHSQLYTREIAIKNKSYVCLYSTYKYRLCICT
jgi:hypothetical protein